MFRETTRRTRSERLQATVLLSAFLLICLSCGLGDWRRSLINGYDMVDTTSNIVVVSATTSGWQGGVIIEQVDGVLIVGDDVIGHGMPQNDNGVTVPGYFVLDTAQHTLDVYPTRTAFEAAAQERGITLPVKLRNPSRKGDLAR